MQDDTKNWLSKHADTVAIMAAILSATLWMNGQFNDIRHDISEIHTEIAVMKAVMIMQKIMPSELAKKTD